MRRFFWAPKINVILENTILHIYLSIYLSIYQSIYLSIYLSNESTLYTI